MIPPDMEARVKAFDDLALLLGARAEVAIEYDPIDVTTFGATSRAYITPEPTMTIHLRKNGVHWATKGPIEASFRKAMEKLTNW